MGQFKEKKIEESDQALQDIEAVQRSFHEQTQTHDEYSLYLPHYDEEVGGLLLHERGLVPASWVFDSLKG